MKKQNLLLALVMCSALIACKKDNSEYVEPTPAAPGGYGRNGVFVSCEGSFMNNNGTISFYSKDSSKMFNNIYENANNNISPGDIVQSFTAINGKGYVVVNNSNTIRKVNLLDFKLDTSVAFTLPRFVHYVKNDIAYVSTWENPSAAGKVHFLNIVNNTIVGSVTTGTGPDKMLFDNSNNRVFVLNAGGFSFDSTITVINTNNNSVEATIQTGSYNPSSIAKDANGNLWVLCSGYTDFSTGTEYFGKLIVIDPATLSITKSFAFNEGNPYLTPNKLIMNSSGNTVMYSLNGKIYRMAITAVALPSTAFIERAFYGLSVDPYSNNIYGADARGFVGNGWVIRYSGNGAILDSFQVGIGPNNFEFIN
ncbi:MAG: hypothetical protein RIQ89_2153 [Bacteroidota bacterium]|jgi:YVTN family beta-propeller protein